MKNVITFVLILALLAGCVPAIAEDDAEYVGTWIKRDTTYPVDLILEIFHLSEDHQAYYLYQAYYRGKPTTSLKYAGTWAQSGNGIDIILSNPAEVKYHATIGLQYAILEVTSEYSNISNSFIAVSNDMLTKMADEKLNPPTTEAPEETGVLVPMGRWRVGEDIPAGKYSVRRGPNSRSVYFRIWGKEADDYSSNGGIIFHEIINNNNPVLGRIDLKDGWLVEVEEPVIFDAPVTLGF